MEIEAIRLLPWLLAMILLPGWTFLSITRLWEKYSVLQRWILAIGISIAFFPVLFYFAREFFPGLHIGKNKLIALFLLSLVLIIFYQRKNWKEQFTFSGLEWLGIAIFTGTIFIRLSLAIQYPIPAWSDSLHHTLLTQLTAQIGQLPHTLEPYEPVVLNMYHLGLYSLSGSLQILSGVPAHTALLWTAQLLNGLCGIGIYFFLDRMIGRKAAIIGALTVGFYSFQPNWYFNWGRFTQLSSQTILLIAWTITWEIIRAWGENNENNKTILGASIIAAGLLNASVFLFHFRVAAYYIPLLLITIIYEAIRSIKNRAFKGMLGKTVLIGLVSLILISPVLATSVETYTNRVQNPTRITSTEIEKPKSGNDYFAYSMESVYLIGARKWLMWITLAALVISLIYYPKISLGLIIWSVILWLEGNAYRLGIPLLNLTNYTAIMIFYYIPIGIILGMAGEAILKLPLFKNKAIQASFLGILLLLGIYTGRQRLNDIEPYRFFVNPADLEAMSWIRTNTESDALFAINTYQWLGYSPHGTDGGYWIPYFTGRKTTTGSMLYGLGSEEYIRDIINMSNTVTKLEIDLSAVEELMEYGVDYIYIGAKGSFDGRGLDPQIIASSPNVRLVYSADNVEIFEITQ